MNLRFLSSAFKGIAIGVSFCLILLLIFSFISLSKADPEQYLRNFSYLSLYIPSLIFGYSAAKIHRSHPLPIALLSGSVFALIIFIMSLFISGANPDELEITTRLILYLLIPIFSCIGGVLGSAKQKKIRRHKKAL